MFDSCDTNKFRELIVTRFLEKSKSFETMIKIMNEENAYKGYILPSTNIKSDDLTKRIDFNKTFDKIKNKYLFVINPNGWGYSIDNYHNKGVILLL